MDTLIYDGTFEGWLSAVFDVYDRKLKDVAIKPEQKASASLFGATRHIPTDEAKARRVWRGLCDRISVSAVKSLYRSFLSEEPGCEDHLLGYARYAFASRQRVEYDYTHPDVRYVIDTNKKVRREKQLRPAEVRRSYAKNGVGILVQLNRVVYHAGIAL